MEKERKAFLGTANKERFEYPLENLKKHLIALGTSGSGKTVLTKVIAEECAKSEIPSIIVDIQGDLSSLALKEDKQKLEEKGLSKEEIEKFYNSSEIKIFTPASSKGIPLCINPLDIDTKNLSEEEKIPLLHDTAHALTKLLGYNLSNQKGKKSEAILYTVLKTIDKENKTMNNFEEFTNYLSNLPEDTNQELQQYGTNEKDLEEITRNIKFLNLGEKKLLFQFGVPLDIDFLLGKGKDKTQISIINLNNIQSQEEKEFFISTLTSKIYQWMLKNPSDKLQFSYIIDEIAPFIPAGNRKPLPKDILKKVFKQARKYGVGCVIATQNPGDIDYQAFSQFGSWAIGRLSVRQDIKKIEQALSSISGTTDFQKQLPKMQTGEFNLFAPDISKKIIKLKTRWLYSKHETLTGEQIKEITKDYQEDYKKYYVENQEEEKESHEEEYSEEKTEKAPKQEEETNYFQEEKENKKGQLHVISINSNEVMEIAEKQRKKPIKLFKNREEKISDVGKVWEPYLLTQIREKKNSFMKKEIKRHNILFNAITGEISVLRKNKFRKIRESKNAPFLTEDQIRILRVVSRSKKPLSTVEIIPESQMTKQKIYNVLKSLEEKSFVKHKKVSGYNQWYSIEPLKLKNFEKISSIMPSGKKDIIEGKVKKPKITEKDIKRFIGTWFENADIVKSRIVYMPFYTVVYTNKKGLRKLKINGITKETEEI